MGQKDSHRGAAGSQRDSCPRVEIPATYAAPDAVGYRGYENKDTDIFFDFLCNFGASALTYSLFILVVYSPLGANENAFLHTESA